MISESNYFKEIFKAAFTFTLRERMRRCVEVKKVRTNAQGHIWCSHINMMLFAMELKHAVAKGVFLLQTGTVTIFLLG